MTKIIPLADRPAAIPQLARWFHKEWSGMDGRSIRQIENQLGENLNRGAVPMTWLAMDADDVIGSVSLDRKDLEGFDHLSPWLACLYVDEAHRGHGVGRQLISHVLAEAGRLGMAAVHLWTWNLESRYREAGWNTIAETLVAGRRVAVMRYDAISTRP